MISFRGNTLTSFPDRKTRSFPPRVIRISTFRPFNQRYSQAVCRIQIVQGIFHGLVAQWVSGEVTIRGLTKSSQID